MRNNTRKVAGTSKMSKTRVNTSALGLLNPQKHQRMHQEQEVYHRLYKDKLEKLVKDALVEQVPELKDDQNDSDDEEESDGNGDSSSKGDGTETNSRKQVQVLRMKIRREVWAEAWANETEEVCCRVKKELMHE